MNNNMITCSKCGAANVSTMQFCAQCGNNLQNNMVMNTTVQPQNNMMMNNAVQPQNNMMVNSQQSVVTQNNSSNKSMNYFKYMCCVILKPHTEFKKNEEGLASFKNSALLSLILAGIITIINLFTTMYNSVRIKSLWSDKVEWVWENLKNIKYFEVIGKNFLMYAILLFAVAGVYYLGALVAKKQANFSKLLGISVASFIPMFIFPTVVSPIFGLIHWYLSTAVTIASIVYSFAMLVGLTNTVVVFENTNAKIYYNFAVISIIFISIVIIGSLMLGSLFSGLGMLLG